MRYEIRRLKSGHYAIFRSDGYKLRGQWTQRQHAQKALERIKRRQ